MTLGLCLVAVRSEGCEYRVVPAWASQGWFSRSRVRLLAGELHHMWQPGRFPAEQVSETVHMLEQQRNCTFFGPRRELFRC